MDGALRFVHPPQRIEFGLRFGVEFRARLQPLGGALRFDLIDRLVRGQAAAKDEGDDAKRGGRAEEDDEGVGRAVGGFGRHISC